MAKSYRAGQGASCTDVHSARLKDQTQSRRIPLPPEVSVTIKLSRNHHPIWTSSSKFCLRSDHICHSTHFKSHAATDALVIIEESHVACHLGTYGYTLVKSHFNPLFARVLLCWAMFCMLSVASCIFRWLMSGDNIYNLFANSNSDSELSFYCFQKPARDIW